MKVVKSVLAVVVALGIVFSSLPAVHADETSDLILKLLVKKGLVTQQEVDELKAEITKAKIPDAEKHAKSASWAEKIKVKGDIRLRDEYERPGSGTYVHRQRIRVRAGIEAKITDSVEAGIALATGDTGNARSTNQTLTDAFGTKAFDLDMAYVTWNPIKEVKISGGKYAIPLYHTGDLLWDSDLRFEGASTNIKYRLINDDYMPVDIMANTGYFVLDDLTVDKKSPYLFAVQGGLGTSFGEAVDLKGFFGYLDFIKLQNTKSTDFNPSAASSNPEGDYRYDYNILEVSGEATFHFLEEILPAPFNVPFGVFGDYIYNYAAGETRARQGHGVEIGGKIGKKPKQFGDWLAVYNFRKLGKNAFPEQFPDADAFRGRTDGFGHEVIFSFGLAKNIWLEFDYYAFRDKTQGTNPNDKWGHLIQTDLNVKF